MSRPLLIFTVDVEEDMPGWRITDPTSVRNIDELPRLAALCAELGVRPTYLCDYPVVSEAGSSRILRELAREGNCEIGTHMHPWNTPPFAGVVGRDGDERFIPYYQLELGAERFRDKLAVLHPMVEEVAGASPVSYRAGRFGIDPATLHELLPFGYEVDSSITPLEEHLEDDGPDFRSAPQRPYRPHVDDVAREGDVPLVEIPLSVGLTRNIGDLLMQAYIHLPKATRMRGLLSKDYLRVIDIAWLYPPRFEYDLMRKVAHALVRAGQPVVHVFLHSSELAPGLSGRNETSSDVEETFDRTRRLLLYARDELNAEPVTLGEAGRRLRPSLGL